MPETGRVGEGPGLVSPERAKELAAFCALNVIAAVKSVVGDLDRVERVVKVVGFVASDPSVHRPARASSTAPPSCSPRRSASAGVHARSAVGVVALPLDAPVEVEAIVHVRD